MLLILASALVSNVMVVIADSVHQRRLVVLGFVLEFWGQVSLNLSELLGRVEMVVIGILAKRLDTGCEGGSV